MLADDPLQQLVLFEKRERRLGRLPTHVHRRMKDLVAGGADLNVIGPINRRQEPLADHLDPVRLAEMKKDQFDGRVERAPRIEFGARHRVKACEP